MNCRGFSDISNLLHFFPSPGVATESHSQLTLFWVSAVEDFCRLVFLVQDVRLEFSIVVFFPYCIIFRVGNPGAAAAS